MRAIVLVGGFGTRLRPLTHTRPKPLLPVAHVPMIERIIGRVVAAGIHDVTLSLGFKPDAFRAAFPDGTCAGARLTYAVEDEPLGTAGAVRFAAAVAGIDDTFLVLNGDILCTVDLRRLIAFHRERGAEGTIHLTPVDDPSAFGVVPTDDTGRVLAFIEKPPRHEAPTNHVNAGTYVLEPSVLDRIPEGRAVSIERETFPAMVADATLYAVATADEWLDTGRPDQYVEANLDMLDGRFGPPVEGIHPSASIAPGATVIRSVIGAGCVVADGAHVCGSVLLPGAQLGAGAVVRDSVVGEGAVVGAGSLLDDVTVIGDGAVVAPGAVLHAGRLPEPAATP